MRFDDWINGTDDSQVNAYAGWKELAPTVKRAFPWVVYVIEIDDWRIYSLDVKPWCEQNLIGKYDISVVSYFEFEEDSVLFALRWA